MLLLGFVFFIYAFYGPAIIYSPAKRFSYLAIFILVLLFIYLYQFLIKNKPLRFLFIALILSINLSNVLDFYHLYKENRIRVKLKNTITEEIKHLENEIENRLYVILPNAISPNTTIFLNGIKEYIASIYSKKHSLEVIPLFVTSKSQIDTRINIQILENTNRQIIFGINNGWLDIPQFNMQLPSFSNAYFYYECLASEKWENKVSFSQLQKGDLIYYSQGKIQKIKVGI